MGYNLFNQVRNLNVPFSLNLGENVRFKNDSGRNTFADLPYYNAPFNVPDSLIYGYLMFSNCPNFNAPIHIDPYNSNLVYMGGMIDSCNMYNCDINIPRNCQSFTPFFFAYVYDWNVSDYPLPIFKANVNVYALNYQGSSTNFSGAFSSMSGFSGNVRFFDSAPENFSSISYGSSSFNGNIQIPNTVTNIGYAFANDYTLNQNIQIPSSVTIAENAFKYCRNLNQPILLPDNIDAYGAFRYCNNLNSPIRIPENSNICNFLDGCENYNQPTHIPYYGSNINFYANRYKPETNGKWIFRDCYNLNSPITFDDNIEILDNTFTGCWNFNQPLTMPNSLKVASAVLLGCEHFNSMVTFPEGVLQMDQVFSMTALNINIQIPSTVKYLDGCFSGCSELNQNIAIPNGVISTKRMFVGCDKLNYNIFIPDTVEDASEMFDGCNNLNVQIYIPPSVTNTVFMFNNCANLRLSQVNIPNTVNACSGMFANTPIYNVNIQCDSITSSSTSNIITLATSKPDITGLTPASANWNDAQSDYMNVTSWGTPIGYMTLNSSLMSKFNSANAFLNLVGKEGGTEVMTYNNYCNQMNNINNWYEPYTEWWNYFHNLYNHGGVHVATQLVNGDISYHVIYRDYPNATSEEDTNWYSYNVSFY